jgi:hypothetical protein
MAQTVGAWWKPVSPKASAGSSLTAVTRAADGPFRHTSTMSSTTLGGAGEEGLDGAIGAVAHPAVEATGHRLVGRPGAEPDALDVSFKRRPDRYGASRHDPGPANSMIG